MLKLTRRNGEPVYQFRGGECIAKYLIQASSGQRVDWMVEAAQEWRYVREEALSAEDWAAVRAWRARQNEHKE